MAALQTLEDPTFMPGDIVYHRDRVEDFARDYNVSSKLNGEYRMAVNFVGIDKEGKEVCQVEEMQGMISVDNLLRPDEMPAAVLDHQLDMIKKAMTYKY